MQKLHFIVNPISGKGNHLITEQLVRSYFDTSEYEIQVSASKYEKHAIELTQLAILDKPDVIIACGGDGTINEVASGLVGSTIQFGIIPVGSGNGLASNLNIPRDIKKAFEIIKNKNTSTIDVGKINEKYFFSNTGIGIDAAIIEKYQKSGTRTLISYVKASISTGLHYKPNVIKYSINKKIENCKSLLFFISNSNEMGYNMSLTPKASLSDGFLDLIIVTKLNLLDKIRLGIAVLRNKVDQLKSVNHQLIKNVTIEISDACTSLAQIDGESYILNTNIIEIQIIENGLTILI
ncbi:diacylglycerol kinase family lipid kinase [Flavobacterium jejuense]|uniref:Diacylglycerol kinase family lipid kinase n=1 Tax=Flavobacterium jejuense TaxID=1544455 RepID=A0ABX0ISZ4_9FLAO|nr:diacylglycerol kinase family protein [Flavobacterium jejuense]NHN24984.1 diacylglycerol kinase family lipid kinase [Flavobacterium jejuense]